MTPGQKANSDGHRQDEEHDRHHHEDLLAGGDLDQLATAGLADVGGLGVQDVGQRRAALDRDGDALGEPRDRRQPSARPRSVEGRATGSPVRTAASTRARSRDSSPRHAATTRSSAATGLSPAATASASSSATAGTRRAPALARRDLRREVGVAREHAGRGSAHRSSSSGRAVPPGCPPSGGAAGRSRRTHRERAATPDHLLDPEVVHGLVDPAARAGAGDGRRPPSTRSTASAADRSSGPKAPLRGPVRRRVRAASPGVRAAARRGT